MIVILLKYILLWIHVVINGLPSENTLFTLINQTHTWNEARCICEQLNMTPLIMNDPDAKLIYEYITGQQPISNVVFHDVWIGLYNKGNAKYVWTTGDTLEFHNWDADSNEPNDETVSLCVRLKSHLFRTMECDRFYEFVCQKPHGQCHMKYMGKGRIRGSGESEMQSVDNMDECQKICLKDVDKSKQCFAVEFSLGKCVIFSSGNITQFLADVQKKSTVSSSASIYQKICYTGAIKDEIGLIQTDSSKTPLNDCKSYLAHQEKDTTTSETIATTSVQEQDETTTQSGDSSTLDAFTTISRTTQLTSTFQDSSRSESDATMSSETTSQTVTSNSTNLNTSQRSYTTSETINTASYPMSLTSTSVNQYSTTAENSNYWSTISTIASPTSTINHSEKQLCKCTCAAAYTLTYNVQREIQKTRKILQYFGKNTSAARRAKTSAEDDRQSAKAIGSLGIIILSCVLCFIALGDVNRVIWCISQKYSSRI